MSFLDKVTKAVGDAVDKGKKEVDQFVRIQKINNQIQQTKIQVGEKAVDMLRAGTLVSPDLQTLVDQIKGIEQQITAEEGQITEKRAEIDKIKAEDAAQAAASAAAPAAKSCPTCGAPAGSAP